MDQTERFPRLHRISLDFFQLDSHTGEYFVIFFLPTGPEQPGGDPDLLCIDSLEDP